MPRHHVLLLRQRRGRNDRRLAKATSQGKLYKTGQTLGFPIEPV
jgi:hypothetical protein